MKKWNKYPRVLKRKLYLTLLTGTAGVIVSFMVYMVSADSMLLSMSGVIFLFCLFRSVSLWNIIRRDAYAAISGTCTGITVSPLRKYKRVQITDLSGREHSLLFSSHTAVQTGEKYCFYFQNENSPVLGNDYLDTMLSTNTFLGYEKFLEYHAEIK